MEKEVLVCNSSVNQPEPPLALTKEAIMSLNNHSVTFEHAMSLFHGNFSCPANVFVLYLHCFLIDMFV